jgi:peptide/nickel transport system permease protein
MSKRGIEKGVFSQAIRRLRRNILAMVGVVIVALIFFCAIFAPLISLHNPIQVDLGKKLQAPGGSYILGTDEFGRDILSRLIYGSRISISVAFLTVGISMFLGIAMGLLSGYFGGWVDNLIMRGIDILLCFPILLMALALVAVLGPKLMNIMIAVGIALTPRYARIVRSVVLSLRGQQYVEAARGLGAGHGYILYHHILPNAIPPIIVVATLNVAMAILIESSLSFLGLGVQPPTPSWGSMIASGRKWLIEAPWISTFSGIAIMITVMGFNFFGDALRDILDPRLRGTEGDTARRT